ncbi:MAG TPA: hypothetical protein VN329_09485 [Roseomonas sp.]|nr:hypothetical protein [Roseomonas sp.]
MSCFIRAELEARLASAQVDVALFDGIEAMTGISGFGSAAHRRRCLAIPMSAEPFVLIRDLDASVCRERDRIEDARTARGWEGPMPVLARALVARGIANARIAGQGFPKMPRSAGPAARSARRHRSRR